ncbi:MAG TPA: FeoA family protein [Candidatus Sulfotelmatobacter sp.]|nr:FeoA family protein [Candidatus Sulfotelmatobacter sp.]
MVPLSQIPNGHPVVVRTVAIAEAAQTRHLEALGILPGTVVVVERAGPFGGAVMVRVGGARYALGRELCHHILVDPEVA